MVKVKIKRDECVSCGTCEDLCPDFFELDSEDARSLVKAEFRTDGRIDEGTVPESLESCIAEAAEACPVQIIELS